MLGSPKIAWIVALLAGAAAGWLIAFPPAGFGERVDFLLYQRGGFAPGAIVRAIAGLAVAGALVAAFHHPGARDLWARGRARLAASSAAYVAIMAGIGAIGLASGATLAALGVCVQPDSGSYLTFSPERTIGYPLFLALAGAIEGGLTGLPVAQSGVLLGGLATLAHQLGRVCGDRLAAVVAFAFMAGNASLLGYAGSILAETPFAALLALHLAAVAALCVRFRWRTALAAGLALGCAILMRPAGYAFLGALPALLLLLAKRRVAGTAAVAVAAALPLLAAATINKTQHGFFATQSIGGYSLLGHTAHLIEPGMASAFDGLPARIADRTGEFRAEIRSARFPHDAWRAGMNLYNPQLYGAALPAIEEWLAERPADTRPGIDDLVGRLAREAIAHDPAGYARHVAAQYYGLWLLTFLPHGPLALRQTVCLGGGATAEAATRLTPVDAFWAIATSGQLPALAVAFPACWLAIAFWFFAARRSPAWRLAIYAALGVNAYFLGFATTQVALPRYSVVVEPWLVALLIALACALARRDAQNGDGLIADRSR